MSKLLFAPLVATLLTFTSVTQAVEIKVEEKDTIKTFLAPHEDKRVTLLLTSGKELSGKVIEVNENVVHIGQLTGKEFYDAVINTKSIEAIVIRVK